MKSIAYSALMLTLLITSTVMALHTDSKETNQISSESATKYGTKLGMGFTGGATSGIGFAFRKHLPNRFGFHFGGFVLGGKDAEDEEWDYQESWLWTNIGGELLYTIHRQRNGYFRFYLLAGSQAILHGESTYWDTTYYDAMSGKIINEKSEEAKWNWDNTYIIGTGLGMEFLILKHVGFAIELPLSIHFYNGGFRMLPIGNGSLVYFF